MKGVNQGGFFTGLVFLLAGLICLTLILSPLNIEAAAPPGSDSGISGGVTTALMVEPAIQSTPTLLNLVPGNGVPGGKLTGAVINGKHLNGATDIGFIGTGVTANNLNIASINLEAPAFAAPGSGFYATIGIEDAHGLNTFSLRIQFDPTVVQMADLEGNIGGGAGIVDGLISGISVPVVTWTYLPTPPATISGEMLILGKLPGISSVNGSGYLIKVHFITLGAAGDQSSISLSNIILVDSLANETYPAIPAPATVKISDAPLYLDPARVTSVCAGQIFNLDVKTCLDGSQEVNGVDAYISFDPSKLKVVDADTSREGIQIIPGASLNTVLFNNVDKSGGLISYSAGNLVSPYPSGNFTVATIQFQAEHVTGAVNTVVSISLSGNTTSRVVFNGTAIPGTHGNASVEIIPGVAVAFNVVLQGGSRPDSGWIVPITVKFFTQGANDILNANPLFTYSLTTTKNGSTATAQATVATPGTYDISVASPHCLTNVKRGVGIALPSATLNMGTLLEGNANDDNKINIQDFGILAGSYGKLISDAGYDARANFDRNNKVNIADFGLLAANYGKNSPIEVP